MLRHEGRIRELGPEEPESDQSAQTRNSDSPTESSVRLLVPPEDATVDVSDSPSAAPLVTSISPVVRMVPTAMTEASAATEPHSPQDENLMPKKRWNRVAVPAFVAALGTVYLGLFTSGAYAVIGALLVTLVLAGISLRTIRKKEQAGKGFAFAALMIGVIAALVTALTIAYYGIE